MTKTVKKEAKKAQVPKANKVTGFANTVLMVEPTKFYSNDATSGDNKFMKKSKQTESETTKLASQEFKQMKLNLKKHGIKVVSYKQQQPDLPDSVFPNNWISTHKGDTFKANGVLFTYPMHSSNRQREFNQKIVDDLKSRYSKVVMLHTQPNAEPLEGTGSLIFDLQAHIVYVSVSQRATKTAIQTFEQELNKHTTSPFKFVTFNSFDKSGSPIYHTNVVCAVLSNHVILCLSTVRDPVEREQLKAAVKASGKKLINISYKEMTDMCGNIIQVANQKGEACVVMSERVYHGFSQKHREELERHYTLVHSPIPTIENIGGGSARCMVAEIF